jgi:hypothetical protein
MIAVNTHNNAIARTYYGPARAGMAAPPLIASAPLPPSTTFINDCITAARTGNKVGADGLLIIFPEFILQPLEGAYTAGQRAQVMAHLGNTLAALPNSVLVSFGTVVSETAAGAFINEMPYGIGGGAVRITSKDLTSGIDLFDVAFGTPVGWNGAPARLTQDHTAAGYTGQWGPVAPANHTVNFKTKLFGFSICLDYPERILAGRLGGGNKVDVHLVNSCGMEYANADLHVGDHNVTNDKGSVVICDASGAQSIVQQ